MEQILLAYGLPKETAIMMLYKNTKVKVCSPDGNTDSFDIFNNSFKLKKERSRSYPTHTIKDVNYAYDIVLMANRLT